MSDEHRMRVSPNMTFPVDRTEPQIGDEARVVSVAARLVEIHRDFPEVIFILEGHCDDRGRAGYNRDLGLRRARAIEQRLIKSGLPEDRIRALSFGAERPVCTTHDRSGQERNRRVEIRAVVRAIESTE